MTSATWPNKTSLTHIHPAPISSNSLAPTTGRSASCNRGTRHQRARGPEGVSPAHVPGNSHAHLGPSCGPRGGPCACCEPQRALPLTTTHIRDSLCEVQASQGKVPRCPQEGSGGGQRRSQTLPMSALPQGGTRCQERSSPP